MRVFSGEVLLGVALLSLAVADIIHDLPPEMIEIMSEAHPTMRQMLQAAMATNSSANATNETELRLVGSAVSCVSVAELKALALDRDLSVKSNQYSDGTFFCEDYVDYAAACDLHLPAQSCNNRFAWRMFKNFERAMNLYSCKSYSRMWTCRNCKNAYKRWLCTQTYRKFYQPDTGYFEEGTVSQGSLTCTCPWPPIGEDARAVENPICVRICNGMPHDCELLPGQTSPTCPRAACGSAGGASDPGLCVGSVYLDPAVSSSETGFYIGAKIEIIAGTGFGQWAEIEKYDGFSKLAMFRGWNKPFGQETQTFFPPAQGDSYRLFLKKQHRGKCRLARRPNTRQSIPCQQMEAFGVGEALAQVSTAATPAPSKLPMTYSKMQNGVQVCLDGSPFTEEGCSAAGGVQALVGGVLTPIPYKYPMRGLAEERGGARCGDHEVCVAIDKQNASFPLAPRSGYACCPNSGYTLQGGSSPELWRVYKVDDMGTNLTSGFLNYSCYYGQGTSKAAAIDATGTNPVYDKPAPIAQGSVSASGCSYNFTGISDKARDDCVLKTCATVCYDVQRRCPKEVEFRCPGGQDRREYDTTLCNMGVPQGCVMDVRSGTTTKSCTQLNPTGYGPLDDPNFPPETWLTGVQILGLPDSTTCNDVFGVGLDAQNKNPPTFGPPSPGGNGEQPVWCTSEANPMLNERTDGPGCREMLYTKFYDETCPQPGQNGGAVAAAP